MYMCVCVQPWFPQQTQLSGLEDWAYVTVTLFREPVLSKRSDKEAQESLQSRGRGCRVKADIHKPTHTHIRVKTQDSVAEKGRKADRSSGTQRH